MKTVSMVFAFLSAAAGLWAALRWFIASRVDFRAFEEVNGTVRQVPTTDVQSWLGAVKLTLNKSGALNKSAAIWTGVSVALAAVSTIFGAFAC
jgi:hypothetical protein